MTQIKDQRSHVRWLAAAMAVLTVVTVPLLASPAHADTVRSLSWHLDTLRIARAHQVTKGAGVTVVVLDSGVQADNQDLVGQVVPGKGFSPEVAGDGRIDPDLRVSHGTGMASLIAGRGGGPQRLLGIAPQAKIMPVAVGADTSTFFEAVRWATDQKPGVISISMGTLSAATGVDEALTYALQRDVVVVVSAGNEGGGLGQLARHPGVVAVGAVDRKGKLWENSSYGPELAVTAPGVDVIMSVNTGNGYGVGSGTSQAAAITSGVVALIRARFPDLDAANVVNRLVKTATDKGDKGRDSLYGFGIVDPVRALTADVPRVDANPLGAPPPLPDGSARGAEGDEGTDDGSSGVGIRFTNPAGLLIYGLGCLAVVGAIVLLIVWSNRRRRRVAPPDGPTGQRPGASWTGPPPPGQGYGPYPPPQNPGYGPPPALGPPPPHPPSYGPPPQPAYGQPPRHPGHGPSPSQQGHGQPSGEQRQPPLSGDR